MKITKLPLHNYTYKDNTIIYYLIYCIIMYRISVRIRNITKDKNSIERSESRNQGYNCNLSPNFYAKETIKELKKRIVSNVAVQGQKIKALGFTDYYYNWLKQVVIAFLHKK